MELYEKILLETIAYEVIPSLKLKSTQLVEMKCYQALCEIYDVVSDETLSDAQCFRKIEEIVRVLDKLGTGGGGRHDF